MSEYERLSERWGATGRDLVTVWLIDAVLSVPLAVMLLLR